MSAETPPAGVGFVVEVTGKDILNKLEALEKSVAEGFSKFDGIPHTVSDHEDRIRALEKMKHVPPAAVYAALVLMFAALGVLVTILTTKQG
jgi:hypothetical protein